MIKLSKVYTRRGYSLFFCNVWSESDCVDIKRWLGIVTESFVIVKEGVADKITAWYDMKKIEEINEVIKEKISNNEEWLDLVIKEFYNEWNVLLPYIKQEKEIGNVEELEEYYRTWVRWWSGLVIVYEIPGIEAISQELRDRALKARKDTQDFLDGGGKVVASFFKRHYLKLSDVWSVMMPNEMFLLKERELTESEIEVIRGRLKGWVLINGELMGGGLKQELKARGWELEEEKVDLDDKEIHGQVACVGQAQGKVRLVVESDHIGEFEKGEVLVTEMTTPEFVPAMKKAAAIVTDEGGVACHAAIVSREMNIPCVIGTKVATKVLKNGDMVEVGANKGVIKRLG